MRSRGLRRAVPHLAALTAYILVAIVFTWPLAVHLSDALTGSPGGDTGNYVWNQWVFQHELLAHRSHPYYTSHLFGGARAANLSLHNYTFFLDVIALPLQQVFGVVTTFNVVYLLMTVLAGYGMFLLALDISSVWAVAWLAGLLFAWNPFMVTRGMGHFSLVAAAPLPLLLLLLRRVAAAPRWSHALAIGAVVWWAASTDVYYAVYSVLIIVAFVAARIVSLHRRQAMIMPAVIWALNVLIVSIAGVALAILVSGGWQFTLFGRVAQMRTLYTPMLALTVLVLVRVALHVRASVTPLTRDDMWNVCRLAVVSGIVAAIMMSPVLYAFGDRLGQGDFTSPRIFWRSSPAGVDLLALVLPNPNHALVPQGVREWVSMLGVPRMLHGRLVGDYLENVASIPWTAMVIVALAFWRGWRPSRAHATLFVTFLLLSLGPFIMIAGFNTHVPGPWALLRYVPVVGLARTPARFVAVVMLAAAVLFTSALAWLIRDQDRRRSAAMVVLTGVLLVFELSPLPRLLYPATIPSIFNRVAAAPEGTAVLNLPFGIRDGASSIGDFSAQSEFFQTAHGKTLLGGYISRVSDRRKRELRADPVLNTLAMLSEQQSITDPQRHALEKGAARLVRTAHIGFVVVDRARTSDELRAAAIDAFQLEFLERDGGFELYRPRVATP